MRGMLCKMGSGLLRFQPLSARAHCLAAKVATLAQVVCSTRPPSVFCGGACGAWPRGMIGPRSAVLANVLCRLTGSLGGLQQRALEFQL